MTISDEMILTMIRSSFQKKKKEKAKKINFLPLNKNAPIWTRSLCIMQFTSLAFRDLSNISLSRRKMIHLEPEIHIQINKNVFCLFNPSAIQLASF